MATHKKNDKQPVPLPRWTPWGEYVQSYCNLYHCDYERFGYMMGRFHMWATADENRVRDIAEFGALPTFPEGLAISYICGVGNAILMLPRIATKDDPPDFISSKSRYWDYLDIVPENRGLPPIGWEDMKPVRELKHKDPAIVGDGRTFKDLVLSETTADLDVIFGPPVEPNPDQCVALAPYRAEHDSDGDRDRDNQNNGDNGGL